MEVHINDKKVQLFKGATLKHALLKADQHLYHAVKGNNAVIRDQEGNITDLNGAVADGWNYSVQKAEEVQD
ncbi:hypothetical protein [Oceanobacillus manasiensis]|uniref:hypothetical protein n=1 Tax=Oceanobacillus manasiensis TaxID=586413 RepID=UPI0005A68B16|nr:hypothetical protein [Oceanobacillus manasiensis]